MADIPAAGSTHPFHLPNGIGREIVMQHKRSEFFAAQRFHPLFIRTGTQGQHAEDLGFSPGEKRASVGPGQHSDFACDGTDFVEFSVIDTTPLLQDKVPANPFLYVA